LARLAQNQNTRLLRLRTGRPSTAESKPKHKILRLRSPTLKSALDPPPLRMFGFWEWLAARDPPPLRMFGFWEWLAAWVPPPLRMFGFRDLFGHVSDG